MTGYTKEHRQIVAKKGTSPPIIYTRIDRPTNALNFVARGFHTNKLCSRLSSSKVRFYTEKGYFASLSPFGGLGGTYDIHIRLIRKRVVNFLLLLIELIAR